jgi:hypothetical protein
MTTSHPEPAQRLVELLETLPPAERQDLTVWLFNRDRPALGPEAGFHLGLPAGPQPSLRRLVSALPAGEDSQLVTIRLPTDRHAELRDWCAEHGFTMAAVVRGLVERFLEQQQRPGAVG